MCIDPGMPIGAKPIKKQYDDRKSAKSLDHGNERFAVGEFYRLKK